MRDGECVVLFYSRNKRLLALSNGVVLQRFTAYNHKDRVDED